MPLGGIASNILKLLCDTTIRKVIALSLARQPTLMNNMVESPAASACSSVSDCTRNDLRHLMQFPRQAPERYQHSERAPEGRNMPWRRQSRIARARHVSARWAFADLINPDPVPDGTGWGCFDPPGREARYRV